MALLRGLESGRQSKGAVLPAGEHLAQCLARWQARGCKAGIEPWACRHEHTGLFLLQRVVGFHGGDQCF